MAGNKARKMHDDEVDTNAELVRTLLAAQFPQWAALPLAPVESAGTDNAIYRLGDAMAARLPRIHWAVAQVEKEARWLPRLAPHLPLAIPAPIAMGEPGAGYPWRWSIVNWLQGENATLDRLADPAQAARGLARFIRALQAIETTGAPLPGAANAGRGVALALRAAETRTAIASLEGRIDTHAATVAWDAALAASVWDGQLVWIHGDLQAGNLLAVEGRLSAVIDFGCLGIGNPACDLQPAWNLFNAAGRATLRGALGVDDATWARGRGWALSVALIQLPYYWETNPTLAAHARTTIAAVLADS